MRAAIAFLSPFGRASDPTGRTMEWFPYVGIVIGSVVGALWWGAERAFPPELAAAIAVGGDAVVTGGLHLDGLADAADGLLAPMSRQRRLEVMRDPAVGAFGAVALVVVLLLRFASFAGAHPTLLAVGALWGISRAAMVVIAWSLPYARRGGGLATAFVGGADDPPLRARPAWPSVVLVVAGVALCVALAVVVVGVRGLAMVGAAVLSCAAVAVLARTRLGGFTGDVLGAAGVVGETVGLMVLAARWS